MKTIKLIIIIIGVFTLYSCLEDDKDVVGPCVHEFREPILNITSIHDQYNNPIPFVKIREFKINNRVQNTFSILTNSYSVVADDSIYYCNVPFGFGTEEGTYEFILEINDTIQKNIRIENVNYSIFEGGCPSFNDGGKRVQIVLD